MDFTSFEDLKNLLSQETGYKQAQNVQSMPQGGPLIQRSIIGSTIKFKKQVPRQSALDFEKRRPNKDGDRRRDRMAGSLFKASQMDVVINKDNELLEKQYQDM